MKIDASTAIRVRAVFSLAVTTAFLASFLARPADAAEVWEKTLSETFDTNAAAGKVATRYADKLVLYHAGRSLSVHGADRS